MKVGIAGIGGIGSNVARHLAQAKVKHLKIVDFDCVEETNLNRQFYRISQIEEKKTVSLAVNLKEIFPQMIIEVIDQQIGAGDATRLFSDCAVVVEGFDDKFLKKQVVEELSISTGIVVSASGIGGTNIDNIGVRKMGNCHIVGDFISDQKDHSLFPPKIAVVAATMAKIVLEHIKDLQNG